MGRGKSRAKQVKLARDLKYGSGMNNLIIPIRPDKEAKDSSLKQELDKASEEKRVSDTP
jgi:hypothetical protein